MCVWREVGVRGVRGVALPSACTLLFYMFVCVCVCVCFVCVPSPVTCMLRECRWAGEEAREEEEMVVERCCHDVKAGR